MSLEAPALAKFTIEAYADQEFTRPAGQPWRALFNPGELSRSRKNTYRATPSAGSSAPQTSYGGGEPDTVTVDLFLDGTGVVPSTQTVGQRLDALLAFTQFQPDTHQPYYVHAFWGRFDFRGVLAQVDISYQLFDRTGEPLRAAAKITLQEVVAPQDAAAAERRQSPDLFQTWLVNEGDTLDGIAAAVYGDPAFWRPLATANRVVNPRGLVAGMVLRLPPKDRARPAGGGR